MGPAETAQRLPARLPLPSASLLKLVLAGLLLATACASDVNLQREGDARPNVLLLCVDDLRPELRCFGADYVHSPNIDGLARQGVAFTRHYVQAPTCGASRYALWTGRYGRRGPGRGNDALVARAEGRTPSCATLPEVFRSAGYTTVAVGKVSHYPGGHYGDGWSDPRSVEMPGAWTRSQMPTGPWRTPQGGMHGLANGRVRVPGVTPAFESNDGPDEAYPDGLVAERALEELDRLARASEPFFLAVGFIRPHLPFGAPARYMRPYEGGSLPAIGHPEKPSGRTTWHGSGELMQYQRGGRDPRRDAGFADELRRYYAACVTYADALVGRLLRRLDELELADDTIVVLWGDHGWHLGEHGIWGKHSLFEESLRAPLVIRAPGQGARGATCHSVVESVDLFPTLCALTGLDAPVEGDGRSLVPQLRDPSLPGRPAISYKAGAETVRTARHRLVRHVKDGRTVHVELYDHAAGVCETVESSGEDPQQVATLLRILERRLGH